MTAGVLLQKCREARAPAVVRALGAWSLTKERRRHFHGMIDFHRLPVTHITLRRGSPQTLVLTKQENLFDRKAALRARQKALLGRLRQQRSAFSDTGPAVVSS